MGKTSLIVVSFGILLTTPRMNAQPVNGAQGMSYGDFDIFKNPGPIDKTDQRSSTIMITANTSFYARKMKIPFEEIYTIDGANRVDSKDKLERKIISTTITSSATSAAMQSEFYKTIASTQTAIELAPYLSYISNVMTVATVIQVAWEAYNTFIVADHTKKRGYFFIAPVDGFYTFSYSIPGDWDKPATTIDVNSYIEDGSTINRLHYDQTNVSDRTSSFRVFCSKGLNLATISLGSGSVLTHNDGALQSVCLDSDAYLTWTVPDVPIVTRTLKLKDILPSVGSNNTQSLTYSPNRQPDYLVDGYITYGNPQAKVITSDPAQITETLFQNPQINIIDANTVKELGFVFFQLRMERIVYDGIITGMAIGVSTSKEFSNNTALFNFTRLPDVPFTIQRRAMNTWRPQ